MNYSSADSSGISDYLHLFATINPFDMTFILQKTTNSDYQVVYTNRLGASYFRQEGKNSELASVFFTEGVWIPLSRYVKQLSNYKDGFKNKIYLPINQQLVVFDLVLIQLEMNNQEPIFYVTLTDRTKEESERTKLLDIKEKYDSILDHNLDPLVSVNELGKILYANPAVVNSYGFMPNEMIGRSLHELVDDMSQKSFKQLMERAFQGQAIDLEECSIAHKNGHFVPVYMKTIPIIVHNVVQGVHLLIRDTSPHIENKEKLFYLSYHDHLTGLWNHRALKEHLREDMRFAELNNEEISIVYIDLDRFKLINDSLGYNSGDELLKRISDRLNLLTDRTNKLYRHSGDEFVFVLCHSSKEKSENFANIVLKELSKPFYVEHQEYFISASMGISMYPADGQEMDVLLKKADQALFYVKDRGRAHYRFYREDMNQSFPNEALMESHLRRAIEMDELSIHYQPQVDLKTGVINSFEALLRWNNRKFGFVTPSQFIPIAEESGLIIQIGEWVLQKVCMQLSEWQKKGYRPMRVAINISPKQFKQETFATQIEEILKEHNVNPRALEVEITESAMTNMRETLSVLNDLKAIGVVISIDDFGTGYSSLSYLKRYPIDIIKIDQSFIRDIETDEKNAAIAKTIIHLAHSLGMEVIAEGVEKVLQVDFLKAANCHKAQGFYFSRPVPIDEITARYMN
ncbi:MAG: putative bifunctional diguanylate cyclase/phosphodiesterase [Paenisporosarcina sp.]